LSTDGRDPALDGFGDELGTLIGADVIGHAARDEQVGQGLDHVDSLELPGHLDGQTLARDPSTGSG
jgi:hypothetical protein